MRPQGLQVLVAGRVSAYDSAGKRLYQHGPGDAVRPVDALKDRTVAVVADGPCRTTTLSAVSRDWLETHRPGLALKLYRYLLAGHFQAGSSFWPQPPSESVGSENTTGQHELERNS